MTAAIIPALALIGGGVDISRGYLTKTRLQQACDAGVLATRKKVGSTVITNGKIPTDANATGLRFFNLNFQEGAYGSTDRTFSQTIGSDYSINATATASVPTTLMRLFGTLTLPVTVACSAQFNYANTDIMMVLDTTGSMNEVNSGDTSSRIVELRKTVKDFYAAVEGNKSQGVRIRYGFVPYSTNVNVGFLLKSSWMADKADYETRTPVNLNTTRNPSWYWRYDTVEDLDVSSLKGNSADALYKGGTISYKMGGILGPGLAVDYAMTFGGCIEERKTYIISDYNNVDLTRARDLDLDLVPTSNVDTQWRPMLPEMAWLRSFTFSRNLNGTLSYKGSWSPAKVDTRDEYAQASAFGLAACPSKSRKLAEMTASDVATYVDGLAVGGSTYHDIGMIWGGRLLSPTGLFAGENAEINGRPTMRHLIFLTDGETSPLEFSYGTYGVEPLSKRRWDPDARSGYTHTQTVEKRFAFACDQVKNRNITVWVIGFGTNVNSVMQDCAGSGHWFQADNATQLSSAFSAIAAAIGDLRIIK